MHERAREGLCVDGPVLIAASRDEGKPNVPWVYCVVPFSRSTEKGLTQLHIQYNQGREIQ